MKKEFEFVDRREFFSTLARGAALLGLAHVALGDEPPKGLNPFAYDVARFSKTDPKLIGYDEVGRWPVGFSEPKRMAAGPDGQLYVCGETSVRQFGRSGVRHLDFIVGEQARCAAVDGDGTVYVGLRDHVEVYSATGVRRASWEPVGKKAWLTGLALSESEVFAADSGGRAVLRYDKTGKFLGRIGDKDPERNVPGFIVPSPFLDVAFHRDGLLRVNNPGRHRVELYTPKGDFETAWGEAGFGVKSFCGCCNPIAIDVLPDGRAVTCEKGIPRVKISSATGEFESVVAGPESFPENAGACSDLNDCVHGGLDAAVDAQGRISILDIVTRQVAIMKRRG